MSLRRVFALAGIFVLAASASIPTFAQDKKPAPEQQQRKLTNEERRDYLALSELVDAVMAGKQPAPADVKITFNHHFLKSNKNVYIPYMLDMAGGTFSSYPVTMYVRAVGKAEASAVVPGKGVEMNWPFADVYFLNEKSLTPAGDATQLGRALELPPGEYTVYIAMRERQPKDRKQQPKQVVSTIVLGADVERRGDTGEPNIPLADFACTGWRPLVKREFDQRIRLMECHQDGGQRT